MISKKIDFKNHPNYEIIEQLGEGGFGCVYKVLNKFDNKIYAIKKVSIKGLNQKELDLIKNEANILSSIDNENIIKCHDSFIEDDYFNIAMEYCEFGDLRKLLNDFKSFGKFFSKKAIYYIIENICLGLKEIHEKNLIHRDLKPENIFLKRDLKFIIGDFGIAKQLKNGTVHAKTKIGTTLYMAPEIFINEKYTNKVDIYSLGCIIYELCTLNFYFSNKTEGKINVSLYGNDLQDLINKLVEKEPNKRPNVEEIYKIVDKYNSENKETRLTIFKKNEMIETIFLEMCIIKYLDQIQDRAVFRENRNKAKIDLALNSVGLTFNAISFFVSGPIGTGLVLAAFTLYGISYLVKKYSKKDEFIKENEIIFELIESKMQKEILKNFEYKIPKEKIIIYNDEYFEKIIEKIKNIILKKNYLERLKEIEVNHFNVLLLGCTGVGKSTLINEFLKIDKDKRAKESAGIPTETVDFIPYEGKNNSFNYILHDTNGITYLGKDSIDKKINNTLNQIKERIKKNDPNNLIHCIWYCYNGANIQPGDIEFIIKLLNIYSTYSIPLIFVHTQTDDKNVSKLCKQGLEMSLKEKNIEKEKIEDLLKNYIDVLARDKIIDNNNDNDEEEEEREKKPIIIPAKGLKKLEKLTREEIKKKGFKSAYFECIKKDIMPLLINGAFEIIFTESNMNILYSNASEDLNKFVENLISIIEDKELKLTEDIKKRNRKSIDMIHDSFKKAKDIIKSDLKHLLSMDKLKIDNKEFLKVFYDNKSEEYKKIMNFEKYCEKVENIIYKNISDNAEESINNMMNIFFNVYIMNIIKLGVKEQFSHIEKKVIGDIYEELFKNK